MSSLLFCFLLQFSCRNTLFLTDQTHQIETIKLKSSSLFMNIAIPEFLNLKISTTKVINNPTSE